MGHWQEKKARDWIRKTAKTELKIDDEEINRRGLSQIAYALALHFGLSDANRCDADSTRSGETIIDLVKDIKTVVPKRKKSNV